MARTASKVDEEATSMARTFEALAQRMADIRRQIGEHLNALGDIPRLEGGLEAATEALRGHEREFSAIEKRLADAATALRTHAQNLEAARKGPEAHFRKR